MKMSYSFRIKKVIHDGQLIGPQSIVKTLAHQTEVPKEADQCQTSCFGSCLEGLGLSLANEAAHENETSRLAA